MKARERAASETVIHVIGRLDIGGVERMLLTLLQSLQAEGVRSRIVCLGGMNGLLAEEFAAVGIPETACAIGPVWTFPVRLRRLLRQLRPDIVVSHVSVTSGIILMIARFAGVRRRIAMFHSDGDGRRSAPGRRLYRSAMRMLLRLSATQVVGVTESTLAFSGLKAGGRIPLHIIPNTVDTDYFRPLEKATARRTLDLPSEGLLLVHAGRASPEKNRHMLPKILAGLTDTSHMALAGATTISDLGLHPEDSVSRRIHNLGLLRDVRPLLAAGDLLVLPSVREGMPMIILEAIACGRPVVVTDLPGVRLVAGSLPDIHLVPTADDAEGFAAAVLRALSSDRSVEQIRQSLIDSDLQLHVVVRRWVKLCRNEV